MRKILLLSLSWICCISMWAQTYSLQELVSGKFYARSVRPFVSSSDGMHYYQTDAKKTTVIKYAYATGEAVDTLFSTNSARECPFDSFQGFLVSPDENRVLLYNDTEGIYRRSFKATYYYHDVRRNMTRKLTDNKDKQMIPTFSPDGKMLAYVMNNNIWLAKFDFDTETQITNDGVINSIINGVTDWVYEEEFATTQLMEFSPDSKLLAFIRTDETNVPQYQFQTFNKALYPTFYTYKYPKPGEENAKVSCHVFDIQARTTRKMNVPLDNDGYIPRIQFTEQPDQLAVMTLNRNQNRFDMYFVNPRTTVAKLILREENDRYIDSESLNSIHFFSNRFTYLSERNGYQHLYVYKTSGTLEKQVTDGLFDVTNLLAVDAQRNTLYYEAADDNPLQRNIYKVNLQKGTPIKLSNRSGMNSASFSRNGKFFIKRFSNNDTPTITSLCDNNGKELRVLEANSDVTKRLLEADLPRKEFISVTAADGTTPLNGWILKPKNFNPSKKYPLVMVQYSGPNSQQVLDQYRIGWEWALLNEDILVACVDGHGTGARGEAFRKSTYMNLGIQESDDQIAAARHFGSLPYIDENRIGIWGWSYGGYNVLMSMSRGNGIFKAGVAIAAVTDWRFYDTVYTERFMRTPQQNPQGYDNGSALRLADKIEGKLLLIHGTSDDNVHLQNAMEYTRALVTANKQFEMFVFPDKDHSIYGGNVRQYLYEKIIRFYKDTL